MQVAAIMTRGVVSCQPDDSLARPAQIMWERDCGFVPVTDENEFVVGVVTDRDICMAAFTQGRRLDEIPVHKVMTRKPAHCQSDEALPVALERMASAQVRRLPVVEATGRLVGVLSVNDLVLLVEQKDAAAGKKDKAKAKEAVLTADELARVLSGISRHRGRS